MTTSTTWGNHSNSTFTYTKSDGTTATKSSSSTSVTIPAGSTDYTKVNNIYDMAGNVKDATIGSYGTYRRSTRGGCSPYSGTAYSVSSRYGNDPVVLDANCRLSSYSLYKLIYLNLSIA